MATVQCSKLLPRESKRFSIHSVHRACPMAEIRLAHWSRAVTETSTGLPSSAAPIRREYCSELHPPAIRVTSTHSADIPRMDNSLLAAWCLGLMEIFTELPWEAGPATSTAWKPSAG